MTPTSTSSLVCQHAVRRSQDVDMHTYHAQSVASHDVVQAVCACVQTLAASLDEAVRPEDSYFNKLIRIMATRCMTQAVYFGSGEVEPPEYLHYGLAAPLYTHFTSPIRR